MCRGDVCDQCERRGVDDEWRVDYDLRVAVPFEADVLLAVYHVCELEVAAE